MTDAAPSFQNASSKSARTFSDFVIPSGFVIRASLFISSPKKENSGEDCVCDQHGQQGLDDRTGRGLTNTFCAAFHMQAGVTRDCDNDPREYRALDHSRIQ